MNKLETLIGKTIERVSGELEFPNHEYFQEYFHNGIYLHFTDGTTVLIEPHGYEADGVRLMDENPNE